MLQISVVKNQELCDKLAKEKQYIDLLESEVTKLSEAALSAEGLGKGSVLMEEYRSLQREFRELSEKCEFLEAENKKLSGQASTNASTSDKSEQSFINSIELKNALDHLRTRVNDLLHKVDKVPYNNTIQGLQKEVPQLTRSREYLRKLMHNIGVLYTYISVPPTD